MGHAGPDIITQSGPEIQIIPVNPLKNHAFIPDVNREKWLRWRNEAYTTFLRDVEIGYADKDLVGFIIDIFERCNHLFTISSCSGRITLVDSAFPWQRRESSVVFKKHDPIEVSEILSILTQPCVHRLWLIASGPILHFVADSWSSAQKLLGVAREAGFKHSGIISVRNDGIVIEVISGNWISTLLKDGDKTLVNIDALPHIVAVFNQNLLDGKKRLRKLHELVLKVFG